MSGPSLELRDIRVTRGETQVLIGASIRVEAGGAIGIAGSNGSGKTTLLDVISGLIPLDGGTVHIDGRDVTTNPPRTRTAHGLARTFQESHLYPQLTVAEGLRVAAGGRSPSTQTLARIGLEGRGTSYVSELSTGERRRLEFAAATARGATMLLLDEPTAGIAAVDREALYSDIETWRARTGGTLVIVEHDRQALARLVDTIVVLDGGRVDAELAASRYSHAPTFEPTNAGTLARRSAITEALAPPSEERAPTRTGPSLWSLARFGLREFAAGMLSVLTLGVLNRVMKVELGIPLALVATVLAAYNLAAPVAIWAGARSDRHPIRGRHRTPYILGGALVMAAAALLAPLVAWQLSPVSIGGVALGIGVFAAMGVGMYGSGAAYFALLAEQVSEHRERAIAVVYSMLMAGILAGVGLSTWVMPHYEPQALVSLHGVVALAIVALTWWAVRGVEPRATRPRHVTTTSVRQLLQVPGTKRFFVFLVGLTFFAFLQQALLEPFGGDVFDMNVRRTTSFNAVQIVAVLIGMALAARTISPRAGKKRTTVIGAVIAAAGTAVLSASGMRGSEILLYAGIIGMGFGLGVLNVGSLSLMLDMTAASGVGVSMGLWTVAHAVADGAATAGGGVMHTIAVALFSGQTAAYSAVFAVQAVGLIAVLYLLKDVDPDAFR